MKAKNSYTQLSSKIDKTKGTRECQRVYDMSIGRSSSDVGPRHYASPLPLSIPENIVNKWSDLDGSVSKRILNFKF